MSNGFWIAPSVTGEIVRVCGVPKTFSLLGYSLDRSGLEGSVCCVPAFRFSVDGQRQLLPLEEIKASLDRILTQAPAESKFKMLPFFVGGDAKSWHASLVDQLTHSISLPKGWEPTRTNPVVGIIGGRELDEGNSKQLVNFVARATDKLIGRTTLIRPGTTFNPVYEQLEVFAKSRSYDIRTVVASWDTYGRAAYQILNYDLLYRCDYFILVNDGSAESVHMKDICQRFSLPFRLLEPNNHKEIKYA